MEKSETDQLLTQLLEEIRLLREAFDSFSSEGFPLKASTPTNEVVMTAAIVAAMLSRERPDIHPQDLRNRLNDAMVIAYHALQAHDAFNQQTGTAQLETLFHTR